MPKAKDLNKKRPSNVAEKSLQNLKSIDSPEMARELQKKGVEARMRNKEKRERLAAIADSVSDTTSALENKVPAAIEVMRVCMVEALDAEDFERAAHFANMIAPYEMPKLASQQIDITERNVKDLTDEELTAQAKELGIDLPNVIAINSKP